MGVCPKRGFPNIKLFNLLNGYMKRRSTNFQHSYSKQPLLPAPSAFSERCFSSAGLTVSELRMQLSGEHLEALNVMHCNKALL